MLSPSRRQRVSDEMDINSFFTEFAPTLEQVLWPMLAGIVLAAAIVLLNKKLFGRIVRRLIELRAFTPQTAVTLREAGLRETRVLRFALREKSAFRKLVHTCLPAQEPAESASKEQKETLASLRFYLPEENCDRASLQYDNNGASFLGVFLACILFFAAILILLTIVPDFIKMIENFIDIAKSSF